MSKPTRDEVLEIVVATIDRAARANIAGSRAIADMVLRDLKAAGVRLVLDRGQKV